MSVGSPELSARGLELRAPRIVGLDLSLTSTGIACTCGTHVVKHSGSVKGWPRIAVILNNVRSHATGACGVTGLVARDLTQEFGGVGTLVVLEGYGFNSMRGVYLGELGGIIRFWLWQRGIPYIDIPPKRLKKYATDNGNAGKDEMLSRAIRSGYDGSDNNGADAWWLRAMGEAHYRDLLHEEGFAYRQEILAAVEWPLSPLLDRRTGG